MRQKLFIVFSLCVALLNGKDRINELKTKISAFTYANQYDSAHILLLNFNSQKDLSPVETFYGQYILADIFKGSNNPSRAIEQLQNCKKYLADLLKSVIYESLIEGNIAECYFNTSNYDQAKKHALLSIQLSPDSSLRSDGHAVNYILLGYSFYVSKDYKDALSYYNKAMQLYRSRNSVCETPLCYMKIAKVYNSMGNKNLAEENISKAIELSDSCGIQNYKLLSKCSLLDIYKENKDFEKALNLQDEINQLVSKMEFDKQGQLITELEVKYKTTYSQKENEALKKINETNEKAIARQKIIIYIIVIASLILSIMIFFLVKLSNQRKITQNELVKLNAELEQKVEARTEKLEQDIIIKARLEKKLNVKVNEMELLISKLSHDMRSPLTGILGLINVSEIDPNPDKTTYFTKIKESVKRLDDIIIGLFSTVYIASKEQKPEKIKFNEMVNETISNFQFHDNFKKAKFNIVIKLTKDFYSDAKLIKSIIQNLIENAIKYGNRGGTILIDVLVEQDNLGIIIRVTDNGIGIDLEFHDKIFEMFFRGTETQTGTGLGLYILKKSVEKLNGKIELKSEKRRGSTFTIYLPNGN